MNEEWVTGSSPLLTAKWNRGVIEPECDQQILKEKEGASSVMEGKNLIGGWGEHLYAYVVANLRTDEKMECHVWSYLGKCWVGHPKSI